jgi:hypothetical protein
MLVGKRGVEFRIVHLRAGEIVQIAVAHRFHPGADPPLYRFERDLVEALAFRPGPAPQRCVEPRWGTAQRDSAAY